MTGPTDEATADLITLPGTPLADAVVNLIRPVETPSVFNHSIRSYLFARLVAAASALPPATTTTTTCCSPRARCTT